LLCCNAAPSGFWTITIQILSGLDQHAGRRVPRTGGTRESFFLRLIWQGWSLFKPRNRNRLSVSGKPYACWGLARAGIQTPGHRNTNGDCQGLRHATTVKWHLGVWPKFEALSPPKFIEPSPLPIPDDDFEFENGQEAYAVRTGEICF